MTQSDFFLSNSININDYDYCLTPDKIAKFPLDNRDDSKLLLYDGQNISETVFNQIHSIIPDNSLLVFNNSKVINARLHFFKKTGAKIEIFCLEPYFPLNIEEAFQQKSYVEWVCMVGNVKKWKDDELTATIKINCTNTTIYAKITQYLEENVVVMFSWDNPLVSFAEILNIFGKTPIPPYLERKEVASDNERYQTVYSKFRGSTASPTAGLHFTESLLNKLSEKGIKKVELTLHVGAGTFKPVKNELITEHKMHAERFTVSFDALSQIIEHSGPIIAVGTTSVRTLESLYISGNKLINNEDFRNIKQWDSLKYEPNKSFREIFEFLMKYMKKNNLEIFESVTSLMIVPGFKFNVINGIITNFHQPRSTLLLLIAAFVGNDWKKIYNYAINNEFRFLSYGDSSFISSVKLIVNRK